MNQPDLTYGPNTELVNRFLIMIESSDIDWIGLEPSARYTTAWNASWYAAWNAAMGAAKGAACGAACGAAMDAAMDSAWIAAWYSAKGAAMDAAMSAAWGASTLVVIDLIDQETIDILSRDIISIIPDAKELFVKADSNKDAS
jgi:hypothetical protein